MFGERFCVQIGINRNDTRHVECELPCVVVGSVLSCVADNHATTDFQPFVCLVVEVSAEVETLIVVFAIHNTILIEVVHTDCISGFVATSLDVQAVVGLNGCAEKLVLPVSVGTVSPIVEVGIGVATTEQVD